MGPADIAGKGIAIDDVGLEREADAMGGRATQELPSVDVPTPMAITILPLMMQLKSDEEGNKPASGEEVAQSSSSRSSFLFRGDDYYKKGEALGLKLDSQEAKEADIQTFAEHVQGKKGLQSSRYISFSLTKRGAAKFSKQNNVLKARWEILLDLQDQHIIKIYTPEDVESIMLDNPQRKVRQKACGVRRDMERNAEVLVEGQIPAEVFQWAK
jgi:hypothetical protein